MAPLSFVICGHIHGIQRMHSLLLLEQVVIRGTGYRIENNNRVHNFKV